MLPALAGKKPWDLSEGSNPLWSLSLDSAHWGGAEVTLQGGWWATLCLEMPLLCSCVPAIQLCPTSAPAMAVASTPRREKLFRALFFSGIPLSVAFGPVGQKQVTFLLPQRFLILTCQQVTTHLPPGSTAEFKLHIYSESELEWSYS